MTPTIARLALGVALLLLTEAVATEAQQQAKVPRIAFLAGGSRSGDAFLLETFWRRMKELGYIEGQNISAEYRFAEGILDRLPNFAAELVRLKVDVIVAPVSGAVAAKKATDTVPIVVTAGDPVGAGLVVSLAHPGGNLTGLSAFQPELGGKQLEMLKETFPGVSRVAVLSWAGFEANVLLLRDMKAVAERLRVTLQLLELRGGDDFAPAFAAIKAERVSALLTLRNPLSATHRALIVDFAAKNRLPAIYPDREFTEAGGLMSYGVNVADLWGRAAVYVDKILKGTQRARPQRQNCQGPPPHDSAISADAGGPGDRMTDPQHARFSWAPTMRDAQSAPQAAAQQAVGADGD